ncbi:hypothetical protein OG765_04610 [Streptomyces sp. NBC_00555]|uniref:hypothetical protein n=1 Tax=Streptomyces sp. NBC_00555 TaxID=2903662 RepID=UPI0022522E51|nr:hypothetical protein [Streptomyces sp. NBC_00555]MCX5010272.1 hypothetical protein [Streptomyces sp. NBC_00555]
MDGTVEPVAEQEWYLTRETTDPSGTVYSVRNRFSGMCLSVDAAAGQRPQRQVRRGTTG